MAGEAGTPRTPLWAQPLAEGRGKNITGKARHGYPALRCRRKALLFAAQLDHNKNNLSFRTNTPCLARKPLEAILDQRSWQHYCLHSFCTSWCGWGQGLGAIQRSHLVACCYPVSQLPSAGLESSPAHKDGAWVCGQVSPRWLPRASEELMSQARPQVAGET